jgi:hypothetical protein
MNDILMRVVDTLDKDTLHCRPWGPWTAKVTRVMMMSLKPQTAGSVQKVHLCPPRIHRRSISHTNRFLASHLQTDWCGRLVLCRHSHFLLSHPSYLMTLELLSRNCSGGASQAVITPKRLTSTLGVKCILTSTLAEIAPQVASSMECGKR